METEVKSCSSFGFSFTICKLFLYNQGILISYSISQTALFQCVSGVYTRRTRKQTIINFSSVPLRKILIPVWIMVICGTERNK